MRTPQQQQEHIDSYRAAKSAVYFCKKYQDQAWYTFWGGLAIQCVLWAMSVDPNIPTRAKIGIRCVGVVGLVGSGFVIWNLTDKVAALKRDYPDRHRIIAETETDFAFRRWKDDIKHQQQQQLDQSSVESN